MNLTKPNVITSIIICLAAGFIGSQFTAPAIPVWYASLTKPFFSPPSWVFAPVWTVLYIMMGISLYLVWRSTKSKKKSFALKLFFAQLGLNALWSILFFGLKNPWLAFADIVTLWVFIVLTIQSFQKLSPPAAFLLLPYFLWVTFASILNFSIALLN